MGFNFEDKVTYKDLSPSLKDMIDDKVTKRVFLEHANDHNIHIDREERAYWNSIEEKCKAYSDNNRNELESNMNSKINDISSNTTKIISQLKPVAYSASYNDLKDKPDTFFKGLIMPYSGSTSRIPKGWHICDGSNGTPDLRDRFIVGAGRSYNLGTTGGSNFVKLQECHLPNHRHTFPGDDQIWNAYGNEFPIQRNVSGWDWVSEGSGCTNRVYWSGATGGGEAHENRPPFYALYFIMYIG